MSAPAAPRPPATAVATPTPRRGAAMAAIERARGSRSWPDAVMAAGAFVAFVISLYMGRHLSTFLYDEWAIVVGRREWNVDTFLLPHNEHLVAVPVAIFKVFFETVGAAPYWPYRVLVALLVVGLGVLVYRFAIPRLGKPAALVPGLLTVLVGAGGQDIVWPFQIALGLSALGGIGLMLCLDRGTPRAEWLAGAFVLLAVASSSIGLAVLAAAMVDVALHPDRKQRAMRLLLVPVVLYAAWYAVYNVAVVRRDNLLVALQYSIDAAGGAVGALFGLSAGYYATLGLAFLVLIGWAWLRPMPAAPRLWTLVAMPFAFWLLTGIGRAQDMDPAASRYLLPGAIFVALIGCEVLRGTRFPARAAPLAILVVAYASWSHVVALRSFAKSEFEARTSYVVADLAALSLAREVAPIPAAFAPDPIRAPNIQAGPYFAAVDDIGDPTPDPVKTLANSFDAQRRAADVTYFTALGFGLKPVERPRLGAPPPTALAGDPPRDERSCLLVGRDREAVVALPPGGLALRTDGPGRANVRLRRWGSAFIDTNGLDPKVWGVLAGARDREKLPIQVSIGGPARVRVCGLRAP
jgi:hypothetical protein